MTDIYYKIAYQTNDDDILYLKPNYKTMKGVMRTFEKHMNSNTLGYIKLFIYEKYYSNSCKEKLLDTYNDFYRYDN